MATRKENFWKYYSTPAGKKKLNGRSIEEAYAAMRRNVVATKNRVAKNDSGSDRPTRKLGPQGPSFKYGPSREATRKLGPQGPSFKYGPSREAIARRVGNGDGRNRSTTERDMDNLPGLRAKRLSTTDMMRSNFSMNGKSDQRKWDFAKNNPNAGRKVSKAALERVLASRGSRNIRSEQNKDDAEARRRGYRKYD